MTLATTLSASWSERSTSCVTCSVPPRMRIETERGFLQPVTNVILSSPTLRSSTLAADAEVGRGELLDPRDDLPAGRAGELLEVGLLDLLDRVDPFLREVVEDDVVDPLLGDDHVRADRLDLASTILRNVLSSSSRKLWIWLGFLMLILLSISVFLISRAEFSSAIFAPVTSPGIRGWPRSLSRMIPSMSSVSAIVPPWRFSTLIWSTSADRSCRRASRRCFWTAWTAILASSSREPKTPFEPIAVVAQSMRIASSSVLTGVPISVSEEPLGLLDGDLESAGDDGRVDVLLEQVLGALEELAGEDDRGRRSVPALLVLGLRDLHQHLGGRVLDVDLLEDRDAVVRDRDVAHPVDEHLVHAARTERRPHGVRDGPGRGDVVLRSRSCRARVRCLPSGRGSEFPEASVSPIWGESACI